MHKKTKSTSPWIYIKNRQLILGRDTQTELVTGLLFFNVGVEIGQLLFIATFLLLLKVFMLAKLNVYQALMPKPAAYLVGALASYWLIERSLGFLIYKQKYVDHTTLQIKKFINENTINLMANCCMPIR
ncbi:HupE/UreJ family protein [Thalassotalea eurytherma]|uniref:HupE/UreJ family protein n=1 Tax=Thalassotalea eurytherma TaxID=1144278 RepID=UPI0024E0E095|nr:HupE/UreJ family protein [Thalassotalea eurytherma]